MPEYTIPMLGVMREILERELASMRGEEDFFSVARMMPFVAVYVVSLEWIGGGYWVGVGVWITFDAETGYALVYGVEGIFDLD